MGAAAAPTRSRLHWTGKRSLAVQLGVDDRIKLHDLIGRAKAASTLPTRVETNDNILGGEPVFPKSRLAVRQVGGMLIRGARPEDVREDYPYLKDEDIEFAVVYTRAYPRMGEVLPGCPHDVILLARWRNR